MLWSPYYIFLFMVTIAPVSIEGNIQACGSDLTDLLSLLCGNQFHGPGKRSTGSEVRNIGQQIIQKRSGVVDECCHTQCDFNTLQLYCRQAPDLQALVEGKDSGNENENKNGQQGVTAQSPQTTTQSPDDEDDEELSPWDLHRMRYIFVQRLGRIRRMGNRK
ncbi:hypothetical protein FSP39_023286 [Pinctada imbricata]|uniref:Insulin-like domain-containing protein n=1 Tax=Pinctada imbricata TaxID=66713 RepID=A0AA89BY75_PINIB|nr:hypothetical protein FSP39_023286 [Pinctada imbricata]